MLPMANIESQSKAMRRASAHIQAAQDKANKIENTDLANLAEAYSDALRRAVASRLSNNTDTGEARLAFLRELASTVLPGSGIASEVIDAMGGVRAVRKDLIARRVSWNGNHINRIQRHKYYSDNVADGMIHTEKRIQIILSEGADSLGTFAAPAFVPALTVGSGRSWLTGGVFMRVGSRLAGGLLNRIGASLGASGAYRYGTLFRIRGGKPSKPFGISRLRQVRINKSGLKKTGGKLLGPALSFGASLFENHRAGDRGWALVGNSAIDTTGKVLGGKVGMKAGAKVAAIIPPPLVWAPVGAALGYLAGSRAGGIVARGIRRWPSAPWRN